jgi:hypothetical protein
MPDPLVGFETVIAEAEGQRRATRKSWRRAGDAEQRLRISKSATSTRLNPR